MTHSLFAQWIRPASRTGFVRVALMLLFGAAAAPAQPVNDMFANRTVLSGTNLLIYADNFNATMESYEPMTWYGTQGATVWWSWQVPVDCICTISTSGSSFDTVLGVCTGNSVDNLSVEDINDDYTDLTSRVKFDAFAGQTYHVFVGGIEGEQGIIYLRLTVAPALVGTQAPAWTLQKPNGTTVRSTDFAGKVVILDFWATWCGPCTGEIPEFIELQNQYGPDGLAIIGPSVDSLSSTVSQFLATHNPPLNYTVVMANSAIQNSYGGIPAIPTTFIIDRKNIIRRKFVGSRGKEEFVSAIAPFLYDGLNVRPANGGSSLTWKADGNPVLLHTPRLDSNVVWREWAWTIFQDPNGTNRVDIPSTGAGFFRLRYP